MVDKEKRPLVFCLHTFSQRYNLAFSQCYNLAFSQRYILPSLSGHMASPAGRCSQLERYRMQVLVGGRC